MDERILCFRHGIFSPFASVYIKNILKILFIWNIFDVKPHKHLASPQYRGLSLVEKFLNVPKT